MFEHKEVAVTCEESMGNPTEYQKFLKPPKSDISNDGKCTNLVCSQCKKKGTISSTATGIRRLQIID